MGELIGGLIIGGALGTLFGIIICFNFAKQPSEFRLEGYEQGQTDYAKGIIKYQCDTLKSGELHCYELKNI